VGSLYSLTVLSDLTLSKYVGEKLFPEEHLKLFFNKIGDHSRGGCVRGLRSGITAAPLAPEVSLLRQTPRARSVLSPWTPKSCPYEKATASALFKEELRAQ